MTSKAGKKYQSVGIQTNEHGEKWINGFGNDETDCWNENDTVYIDVKENGDYLNFEIAKADDKTNDEGGNTDVNNEIMEAIRKTYQKLVDIEELIKNNK